jgi:hypothetical protein
LYHVPEGWTSYPNKKPDFISSQVNNAKESFFVIFGSLAVVSLLAGGRNAVDYIAHPSADVLDHGVECDLCHCCFFICLGVDKGPRRDR